MGLKEDIDNLRKQGYSDVQIQQFLVSKGYDSRQVSSSLMQKADITSDSKHELKNLKIMLIVLFFGISLMLTYLIVFNEDQDASSDPTSWIVQEESSSILDLDTASNESLYIDSQGQQVRYDDVETVFDSYGYYKGNIFEESYKQNGQELMKIDYNMTPEDGIIEGYVIFKIEEGNPVYYIFVDSDWKEKVSPTNVWWGFEYSSKKEFNFTQISPGIYMDKAIDSPDSFSSDYSIHLNKLFVGDMTEYKINNSIEEMTFIVFQ